MLHFNCFANTFYKQIKFFKTFNCFHSIIHFLFEIVNVILRDPNIILWIATSVADVVAVTPNGIKTLLANGLSAFLIKSNPVFHNGPKSLPGILSHCPILCSWVFDNFILADELFAKDLRSFETWVLVNNNLWGEIFHHYRHQEHLMKATSKLLQHHFLFQISIY